MLGRSLFLNVVFLITYNKVFNFKTLKLLANLVFKLLQFRKVIVIAWRLVSFSSAVTNTSFMSNQHTTRLTLHHQKCMFNRNDSAGASHDLFEMGFSFVG